MLGVVHMHVLRGVKDEVGDLITGNFKEDDIREARDQLLQAAQCSQKGGHKDTENRTAAKVYAQEVIDLVYQLDKDGKMPKIVVAAEHLAKVALVKGALKPGDAAPITARMEDLESVVLKLAASFETFKRESTARPSFASVAGVGGGGGGNGGVGHGQGHGNGRGPGQGARQQGATVRSGQYGHHGGQNDNQLHVPHQPQGRERLGSANKRPRSDEQADGERAGGGQEQDGYTPVQPRRPRKTNCGKSTVTLDGVEAAPVDIFVGNTNPRATEDKIKEVLMLSAGQMPEKPTLVINEVKCLNNLEIEPNPRTRCWRITVPYACKDLMLDDNLYPTGWSHRKFFPAKRKSQHGASTRQTQGQGGASQS